ncbi:tyrosine-type recombinase/integrase [Meiothermus taiwanensis]|uniref:tyrosine-type recombinase/integrase n=1 Tax=Meiothermus taiwanensis TaxID=172827 RepID=UPI000A6DFAF5|nr:tyrosine-type recombinase/integrase [Meiothermus taiwanensis]
MTYQDGIPHAVRVLGKGNKERVVVLSPTAQRALFQWLKHRNLEGHPTSPHLWSHTSGARKGQPFPARTVQAMLKRVAKRAGLKEWARLTPHKLRHSYASALMEAGRGIDEVKELLGHASIATTQIYVHVSRKGSRRLLGHCRTCWGSAGPCRALRPLTGERRGSARSLCLDPITQGG